MKIDPAALSPDASYFWMVASIVPRPIAWTLTLNEDGSRNLAPFSFFTGACADPPLCIISVSRNKAGQKKDTWRNIERTGEYVIHAVPESLAPAMNVTSASVPYGTDEVDLAGLTAVPSERVAPPRVAESPIAMECRLSQIVEVGHAGTAVIIGEILLWHVDDRILVADRIDAARLDAVGRMAGTLYSRTHDLFSLSRPK
jgi:flavin reductase (DIM6/NTAB) family NADH-FMN oxidoreductase RutF